MRTFFSGKRCKNGTNVQCINIFCASMADCWDIKELPEEKEATNVNGVGF
jgi:hypothetical protein